MSLGYLKLALSAEALLESDETTFVQDHKTIAGRLGLESLDGNGFLTAACERLESGPPWLLVLDNADDLTLLGVGGSSQTCRMSSQRRW